MKFSETSLWEDFEERDGILFFAHRCEEMLFHYTGDKYRTPILNTFRIIEEYCNTHKLIDDDIISPVHEDVIFKEFLDAFEKDLVLKMFWGKDKIDNFLKSWGALSKQDKVNRMNYLCTIFGNNVYFGWTKKALLEYIQKPKEKKIIDLITRCFIPELICIGYAPEYIYFTIKKVFFDQKVFSADCLKEFFKVFDLENKEYSVYVATSSKVNILKDVFERRLNASFDDDGNFNLLKKDQNTTILHFKKIEALDPYSAMEKARSKQELLFQFYGFLSNRKKPYIQKKGMVIEVKTQTKLFPNTIGKDYNVISNLTDTDASKIAEEIITILLSNARDSFPILLKSIELHNTALSISDYRNAFLNLWSIMEVLIPKRTNKTNIDTISETLEFSLRRGFLLDIINDLIQNLKDCIPNEYNELLKSIKFTGDEKEKFAALILLPEHDEIRKEFYSRLSNYPILRSRMSQFNSDFKTVGNINTAIEKYCCRVRWHIYRLYRTRNFIIHSGNTPIHIKALGEHLHFYVDEIVTEILGRLIIRRNLNNVENVIIDLEMEQSIFDTTIAKDTRINANNIKAILNRDIKYLDK